jgi:hypothetical protein
LKPSQLQTSLARQHPQVVDSVEATAQEQPPELRASLADTNTQPTIKAKAIASKGALFQQLFGYKPTLVKP